MPGLISIDPGVKALGWAAWSDGVLQAAGCSRTAERDLGAALAAHRAAVGLHVYGATDAAVESMQYRPTDSTPQDLIDVQTIGLGVAGMCRHVHLYRPSAWKGTIPKAVHHRRNMGALSMYEQAVTAQALADCPRGNHKEVLDAIGIGLYHLKRTTRAGVTRT